MKKIVFIIVILYSCSIFSQTPNKTIKDSVFNIGDIILIPKLVFSFPRYPNVEPVNNDSLNLLVNFLIKFPNLKCEIQSHTDSRGDEKYNLSISKRANYIKTYVLKKLESSKDRFIARGCGESNLINNIDELKKCKTKEEIEAAHQINRRNILLVTSI